MEYEVATTDGVVRNIANPAELPDPSRIAEIREPWVHIGVIAPHRYVGAIMELVTSRRGKFGKMEYLERGEVQADSDRLRVLLEYEVPLAEILVDFYDELKSRTQGYASLDYHVVGYQPARLLKLDIMVNGEAIDALSTIIHAERAQKHGRELAERAAQTDPTADVRCACASIGRRQDHRPGDGAGDAQERARQVLRRRCFPQAQAVGASGRRQKAHEAGWATWRSRRRRSWPCCRLRRAATTHDDGVRFTSRS